MTKKEEFKKFMKEEGKYIAIGAAVGAGLGLAAYGALLLYCKGYEKGVQIGGIYGFQETLKWLDETFPDQSNAQKLWESYKLAHPDNVINL